jgi:hypothetical protein
MLHRISRLLLAVCLILPILGLKSPKNLVSPQLLLKDVKLIGLIQMNAHGQLLVCEGEKDNEVLLKKINKDLEVDWQQTIQYQKHKKKEKLPVHSRVLFNDSLILWLHKARSTRMTVLSQESGDVLQRNKNITRLRDGGQTHLNNFKLIRNTLYYAREDQNTIKLSIADSSKYKIEDVIYLGERGKAHIPHHLVHAAQDDIITYAYQMNSTHSKMDISFTKWDEKGKAIKTKEHTLRLPFHSFTFNHHSTKALLYIHKTHDGYYAFGKLDYRLKGQYLEKPYFNGFVGFWVARFDEDFNLLYLEDYPFSQYPNLILKGIIKKDCFMDIKEDVNGCLFMSFYVPGEFTETASYVFYLDPYGSLLGLSSGRSEGNFFGYDKYGVRNKSKKTKIRLYDDFWRYYNTFYLPDVDYKKQVHSRAVGMSKYLAATSKKHKTNTAYTFMTMPHYDLVYAYTKKRELRVYVVPKSDLKF